MVFRERSLNRCMATGQYGKYLLYSKSPSQELEFQEEFDAPAFKAANPGYVPTIDAAVAEIVEAEVEAEVEAVEAAIDEAMGEEVEAVLEEEVGEAVEEILEEEVGEAVEETLP